MGSRGRCGTTESWYFPEEGWGSWETGPAWMRLGRELLLKRGSPEDSVMIGILGTALSSVLICDFVLVF